MSEKSITTVTSVTMDDGVKLHVKVLGDSNDANSKPLLISLHGAPGLSTHLEPEASYSFLSQVYRVLVYDARGSGASDHVGPFSHERWIKDIEKLRRVLISLDISPTKLTFRSGLGHALTPSSSPELLMVHSSLSTMQPSKGIGCKV